MQRLKLLMCSILCVLVLCGCKETSTQGNITEPSEKEEVSLIPGTTEMTVSEEKENTNFYAYDIKVQNSKLAVYCGPGYHYETVGYITDQGSYTIIEEKVEKLGGGRATIWGRISGDNWINLEDAATEDEQKPSKEKNEEVTKETAPAFESYIFKLTNPWVQIYNGPGYSYGGCGEIIDQGSYTIVEESVQYFDSGRTVTWGRLKSGAGWICLDDARLNPEGGPPYRCTECGRADVYISRYALCEDCYNKVNAENGQCERCGIYFPFPSDDLRCHYCFACEECGVYIHEYGYVGPEASICFGCNYNNQVAKVYCKICGTDCSFRGTIDGMCDDCYDAQSTTAYCTLCGTELNEWNTVVEGYGNV